MRGAQPVDQARRDIVVETMRYAKRQRTWFRHQETATWFADADQAFEAAMRWLDGAEWHMTGPFRRAIVVVCDGLGVGEAPDAAAFGDEGSDTLGHVLASRRVAIPNLTALGLGNLTPTFDGARHPRPDGAFGKMAERSAGKDTATGHWEMAGVVTTTAFRVYPDRLPPEIVEPFERRIGRKVLGNKAASGTEILKELGEEHLRTGSPILYTSGDSVFQIAAHEELIPIAELYKMCRIGYEIACLEHGVCRVIARPFVGRTAADFKRTPEPPRLPGAAGRRDAAGPPGRVGMAGVRGRQDRGHLQRAGDLGARCTRARTATASTRR